MSSRCELETIYNCVYIRGLVLRFYRGAANDVTTTVNAVTNKCILNLAGIKSEEEISVTLNWRIGGNTTIDGLLGCIVCLNACEYLLP